MCGICGVIDFDPKRPVEHDRVPGMLRHLRHRGPDDEGLFSDANVALGHRRLSIIDLEGGRQPMFNEDRTVCVVVNGEIYNYKELRARLEGIHRFRTRSDSEVIVHLWEEWGADCVTHLRGMFAFALYDMKAEKVLLARDRFGQKPLVYAETPRGLFFSSEIYPLTRIPHVDNRLCPEALDDFMSLHYIPAPKTVFRGIRKLPPAHTLLVSAEGVSARRYWRIDPFRKIDLTYDEAQDRVRSLVQDAVRYRMIADVPVGAFLSGGVDSSIIVGTMRTNDPGSSIETVCIGYDEKGYDERRYADAVAKRFRTTHFEHMVKPDVLELLPRLARHYGEPYGDPSAIPTWYLSQETAKHVKVALSGDGGDEIFAGYNRYDSTGLVDAYQKVPAVFRKRLIEPAIGLLPDTPWGEGYVSQLKQFAKGASRSPEERFVFRNSVFSPDLKNGLYMKTFKASLNGYSAASRFKPLYERLSGLGETEKLHHIDLGVFLPDDILAKVDIASMANGLEVRSPFLDHVLAEYVASLPFAYKHKIFRRKRILKSVGRHLLEPGFLNRQKMGFRIPLAAWFRSSLRGPLLRGLAESPVFTEAGIFNPTAIRRLYDEHQSGRINHGDRLWNLWFLGEWSKQVEVNWT